MKELLSTILLSSLFLSPVYAGEESETEETSACAQAQLNLQEVVDYIAQPKVQELKAVMAEYEAAENLTPELEQYLKDMQEFMASLDEDLQIREQLAEVECAREAAQENLDAIRARQEEIAIEIEANQNESARLQEKMDKSDFKMACMKASKFGHESCYEYYGKVQISDVVECGKKWTTRGFLSCLDKASKTE